MGHSLHDRWNAVSLRTKITGVTVLVLTFGLLVSGLGTMLLFKPVLLSLVDQQVKSVAAQPNSINALLGLTANDGPVVGDGGTSTYFVALYHGDGSQYVSNWKRVSEGERPAVPKTLDLKQGYACSEDGVGWLQSNDKLSSFRRVCSVVQLKVGDDGYENGTVVVAISTSSLDAAMTSYLSIFLGFGAIVVVAGAILTRMLVTTTFGPLREVERTAAAIADGDFSQRLGGATPNTEVGRLNRSLNTMLNRIDRAFKDRARTIDQMRRFVGDASHELRTPLVSVRGYAELYRMGALQNPDDVAQAMERIEKEAIRMSGLVEDLLELARLDETKPLTLAQVDLLPLAHDAALDANAAHPDRTVAVTVDLPPVAVPQPGPATSPQPTRGEPGAAAEETAAGEHARAADEDSAGLAAPTHASARRGSASGKGPQNGRAASAEANLTGPIAFAGATFARLRGRKPRRGEPLAETMPLPLSEIPIPEKVPPIVVGEENKLRQVLNNLIGNAVRYTPAGSPIEIGVSVDTSGQRACLAVIDHGEGIPPQIREKIFQRFWRADTSRTRETGGSGLGLAIVSSIVAAHNGTVEVVETPGGGATFRVLLPLASSPAAPRPVAPETRR